MLGQDWRKIVYAVEHTTLYDLRWTGLWQWEKKCESQPYEGKNEDEYPLHPVVGDVSQWLQSLKLQ